MRATGEGHPYHIKCLFWEIQGLTRNQGFQGVSQIYQVHFKEGKVL